MIEFQLRNRNGFNLLTTSQISKGIEARQGWQARYRVDEAMIDEIINRRFADEIINRRFADERINNAFLQMLPSLAVENAFVVHGMF